MRCLALFRVRRGRPLPFVVFWCATFIGLTGYLSYLVTLPARVRVWPADPTRSPERPSRIDDVTYDAIKVGMRFWDPPTGLGSSHIVVDDPNWPQTLEEAGGN